MSSKYLQSGESYLAMYPKLRKWINQSIACGGQGFKPEMPEEFHSGIAAKNLRRLFKELALNKAGLCCNCERAVRN